ncbi:MAG: hypothetical protein KBT03_10590 [Bacteroidales bacterium]|nr:hypothetical protein [Candidatus Scybalousia scybalohippi]
MRKLFLCFIFAMVTGLALVSCSKDEVYQNRESFTENTWERITDGKTITFSNIIIEDTTSVYDIYVDIRHTPFINEREVKMLMKVIYPNGITRQSIHTVKLRDRFDKEWVGEAMGDMIDVEEKVKRFMAFPEKGTYTITITNLGKYSEMVGIMDLGIKIKKSNPKDYKNVK